MKHVLLKKYGNGNTNDGGCQVLGMQIKDWWWKCGTDLNYFKKRGHVVGLLWKFGYKYMNDTVPICKVYVFKIGNSCKRFICVSK